MAATLMSETISPQETQTQSTILTPIKTTPSSQPELEFALCDCCGLTEECTQAYISSIRERYQGQWVCGLCAEAVKDEIVRSGRLISTEEGLSRHMNFRKKFQTSTSTPPSEHLITAMSQLLRRSLDFPRAMRSTPSSPVTREGGRRPAFSRSESCSTLAGST
ncbi:hypothetical protein GIB67_008899 [Kingdonia uniflora]|uniref:Uncharacterized protein n=1 Tax=Kingdonia uniflora TaxID=39325 RepID=A0A7J7LVD8_9MAGN|nr:hypothetical protein GIB67_008899 [Kingdonia uniflora]